LLCVPTAGVTSTEVKYSCARLKRYSMNKKSIIVTMGLFLLVTCGDKKTHSEEKGGTFVLSVHIDFDIST
jgi:hypothetical protein